MVSDSVDSSLPPQRTFDVEEMDCQLSEITEHVPGTTQKVFIDLSNQARLSRNLYAKYCGVHAYY